MVNKKCKQKAHSLVKIAKERGLIKSYKEFCESDIAKKTKLTDTDVAYYTSKREEAN